MQLEPVEGGGGGGGEGGEGGGGRREAKSTGPPARKTPEERKDRERIRSKKETQLRRYRAAIFWVIKLPELQTLPERKKEAPKTGTLAEAVWFL